MQYRILSFLSKLKLLIPACVFLSAFSLGSPKALAQLWQPPQWQLFVGRDDPQPAPTGLVSYYSFDRTVADVRGVNHPSTVVGTVFDVGKRFEGIRFLEGGKILISDDLAGGQIGASRNLENQQFTISAWVKPEGPSPTNRATTSTLVSKYSGQSQFSLAISWSGGTPDVRDVRDHKFIFGMGSDFFNGTFMVSSNAFTPGQFYFLTVTCDRVRYRLFVNGALEGEKNLVEPVTYSPDPWTIGNWNGVIDELAFYNRALSETEISNLFASDGNYQGNKIANGATFTALGDLPGGAILCEPTALSADGSVVVGKSESVAGQEGFRWQAGKMTGLGDLPGGRFWSEAKAVSSDGNTVVGWSSSRAPGQGGYDQEGFRWQDGAMQGLGTAPGAVYSSATGISADGETIIGSGFDKGQLLNWSDKSVSSLPIPTGYTSVTANGITPNGKDIVGSAYRSEAGNTLFEAAHWDSGVPTLLGFLPGGIQYSIAVAVSADGSLIAGDTRKLDGQYYAVRWNKGVIAELGVLSTDPIVTGGPFSNAKGISGDGSMVVGSSAVYAYNITGAFLWDETNGMRNLRQLLIDDYGLDLRNWDFYEARAISADGRTIVGVGKNSTLGFFEAPTVGWLVHLTDPADALLNPRPTVVTRLNHSFSHAALTYHGIVDTNSPAPTVKMEGPSGEINFLKANWAGGQNLAVEFPEQTANGLYTFTLTLSAYTTAPLVWALTLDTVAPRITRHAPAGDVSGTVTSFDLSFSEPIDEKSLAPSDIVLKSPSGNSIAITAVEPFGLNSFRATFPVQTNFGVYHFSIGPDVRDLAQNLIDQNGDGISDEPADDLYSGTFNLVPVDLRLSNVTVTPAEIWAGESLNVSWSGTNAAGGPLAGKWADAVYLSQDDKWDIHDTLVAVLPHTNGLASDEVYSASINAFVPGRLPGNYYVLIRSDIYNDEKEATNEANNVDVFGPVSVSIRDLTDGTAIHGSLSSSNSAQYFKINLAPGDSLRLDIDDDGLHKKRIFVGQGSIPSAQTNDFHSTYNQNHEQVALTSQDGGVYYVLIETDDPGTGLPFDLTPHAGSVFLVDISPNRIGNAQPGSVTITGAGFDGTTALEFVSTNGTVQRPDGIQVLSNESVQLNLSLTNWPPGVYKVRAVKGAASNELGSAFEVVQGGKSHLVTRLITPSAVGFNFPIKQTIWIEYRNDGEVAMPAPLLVLNGDHGARITADPALAIPHAGFGTIPGVTDNVQVLGLGSSSTPWILQPGESGRIPVYYLGLSAHSGYEKVTFSSSPVTHSDERIIVWADLEASIRPTGLTDEQWSALFKNIQTIVGCSWGSYSSLLSRDMSYLNSLGQNVTSVSKLWAFEVAKASTSFNPIRVLASSVDVDVPAPGFALVFKRQYNQGVLSRYRRGSLGLGWAHNWEVSAESPSHTNIVIHGPFGPDRVFTLQSGDALHASFTASPSDFGVLIRTNALLRLSEVNGTIWNFNSNGHLLDVEDPNGNRVTLGYDINARLTSLTHSSGKQLLVDYDEHGRLAHLIDPRGPGSDDDRMTTYEYDASGEHLLKVIQPGNRVTHYAYETDAPSQLHALKAVIHQDNRVDEFAYDSLGRLNQFSKNCCGDSQEVVIFNYGSDGTVTLRDATDRRTAFSYGLNSQIAEIRDSERTVHFGYETNALLKQLIGPSAEEYRYAYDDKGNIVALENPLKQITSFSYEPKFNRLNRLTDALGNSLHYSFDNRGNLTATAYADGSSASFDYDANGKVVASKNRRGEVITYTYNSSGLLTSKDYLTTPGITDFTYIYDLDGDLISAISWNPLSSVYETINLQHDQPTGRLTRIEYPQGKWFEFGYDAVGRRTRRTDQDGRVTTCVYDPLGRVHQIKNEPADLIVEYLYDSAGRLIRKTLGNGVFTTYDYSPTGLLTSLVNTRADDTIVSRCDYTYDTSGHVIAMTTLGGTLTYGYDLLGQLTHVVYPNRREVTYQYDAAGNRSRVTDNGATSIYSANSLNQYTEVGAVTFGYDRDGNLTRKTELNVTTQYQYDSENHLVGVTTPTNRWTYEYDAFGKRVGAMHNGEVKRYVIDPVGVGNVAGEYDETGNAIARYEYGIGLLSRTATGGSPMYYCFSAAGHTIELTDEAGAVASSYDYDPFGISTLKSESIPNPFQFVGEFGVMNEGNGLEFMRARYYDGLLGRFVESDPVGIAGGVNFFRYAGNNPVSRVDPIGLKSDDFSVVIARSPINGPSYSEGRRGPDPLDPILEGLGIGPIVIELSEMGLGSVLALFDIAFPDATDGHDEFPDSFYVPNDYARGPGQLSVREIEIDEQWHRWAVAQDGFGPMPPPCEGPSCTSGTSTSVNSFDPNDKVAPAGFGGARFIESGDTLAYEVRFENENDATGPARLIQITDTLDPNLDIDTFQFSEIAFGTTTLNLPSGLKQYRTTFPLAFINPLDGSLCQNCIWAEVSAILDPQERTITVSLGAIDPLTGWFPDNPLLGLLYPNDGFGSGEGHISYLIKPREGVNSGAEIHNQAQIIFDYNEPINTPITLNTIDATAPTSHVEALAPQSLSPFLFQWVGADDPGGSGLAVFDIYVSDNRSPYFLWLNNTSQTSAVFNGQLGHTYSFYSIARDNVGNTETTPTAPDAQTTVTEVKAFRLILTSRDTSNDAATLHFSGDPQTSYTIEVSNDLTAWETLGTQTSDATGAYQMIDPNLTTRLYRFYRARLP